MPGDRRTTLAALRARIDAVAAQPAGAAGPVESRSVGLLSAPPGALHEVFAASVRDGGAALGFAFAQAGRLTGPGRPAVLFLQLLADAQELGLPYGLGLAPYGLDLDQMVMIRAAGMVDLLWAIEEAIACRAVAAVVADIAQPHKALDFTASRRLSLRAAASGASVFLVRYAREREASAARYRWGIAPIQSHPPPFDDRAPGLPRWQVTLEKGSLDGQRIASPEGEALGVEWTGHGFARIEPSESVDSPVAVPAAALSGAAPAALGYRLSQAG